MNVLPLHTNGKKMFVYILLKLIVIRYIHKNTYIGYCVVYYKINCLLQKKIVNKFIETFFSLRQNYKTNATIYNCENSFLLYFKN